MATIAEFFAVYIIYRGLAKFSDAKIIQYGLPLAVGSFLIHATSPKAYVKRLIKKVIP